MTGTLPLLLIAPFLVAVAYFDLRYMRIPNMLSLILLAVFAMVAIVSPPGDVMPRVAVAAAVLAVGIVAFGFRLFGGGDVKVLSALMLFIPVWSIGIFALVFSASLLAGIVAITVMRRIRVLRHSTWTAFQTVTFPMGISIALAGLVHPFVALSLIVPL